MVLWASSTWLPCSAWICRGAGKLLPVVVQLAPAIPINLGQAGYGMDKGNLEVVSANRKNSRKCPWIHRVAV